MAIHEKPFAYSAHIVAAKFLGRPAYFNAADLNRQFEVHQHAIGSAKRTAGYTTFGTFTLTNLTYDGTNLTFTLAVSAGNLLSDIAQIDWPAQTFSTVTRSRPEQANGQGQQVVPEGVYLVVTWAEITKTFADDPALCGITSDEYPTSVPSSNHVVVQSPRLLLHDNPIDIDDPYLILFSILPTPTAAGAARKWDWYGFQNCRPMLTPTVTANSTTQAGTFYTNGSLLEEVEVLRRTLRQALDLQSILDSISTLNGQVGALGNYKDQLPVGTVVMYSGSLTGVFVTADGSTKGQGLGVWAGWALLDGNGGRLDARSKFIYGYDDGKGATPANLPADQVGSYNNGAIGNTGGADSVTLTTGQIPSHTHTATVKHEGNDSDRLYGVFVGQQNGAAPGETTASVNNTGGGGAHENRPTYLVLAYVVKISLGQAARTMAGGSGGAGSGGTGGGSGSGATNQTNTGYTAGYNRGKTNAAADNACPVGVTGNDCTDYQTGYANGYSAGKQLYTANYPTGYNAGKQRGSNGAAANNACPTNTTGDACTLYQQGYADGYADYHDNGYEPGYQAGYSAGYAANPNYNDTPPGSLDAKYTGAYQTGYQAGYSKGGQDYQADQGTPGGPIANN